VLVSWGRRMARGAARGISTWWLAIGSLVRQACAEHLTVLLCISLLWTATHCNQAGTRHVSVDA